MSDKFLSIYLYIQYNIKLVDNGFNLNGEKKKIFIPKSEEFGGYQSGFSH